MISTWNHRYKRDNTLASLANLLNIPFLFFYSAQSNVFVQIRRFAQLFAWIRDADVISPRIKSARTET